MTMTEQTLLMTMSDIADLARVQRPVVSVWRSRSAHTDNPFPQPVARRGGQDVFNAGQVATWLTNTRRGNNPDPSADAAAHASLNYASANDESSFSVVTALLALRTLSGRSFGAMSAADLLDLADEHDPDDAFLYAELVAAGPALTDLATYVDALVEAAFGEGPAFERMMADRFRLDLRSLGDTALGDTALTLMAEVATALRAGQPHDSFIVDSTGSASDVILAIHRVESARGDITVATPDDNTDASRLLRRRLLVHGITREALAVQPSGAFAVQGAALHTAQLPPSHCAGMPPVEMLSAIDQIVLQMTDEQLAVVIAPAGVLSDTGLTHEVDEARSTLLRSGRVRAVVRLPAGLLVHKPLQPQALWVLGAAHTQVSLADRWTLVADLTEIPLTPAAIDDLVSDLVASLGDRSSVRAHAFRYARLVLTRTLLASRDSLVAGARAATAPAGSAAQLALRVDELLAVLTGDAPARTNSTTDTPADVPALARLVIHPVPPADEPADATVAATVAHLLADGHVRYIPGNRLEADDIDLEPTGRSATSIRVIGPAELLGEAPLGGRRIDRLKFAAAYPAGRVTEPGDVIFCTSPHPAAVVDDEGTSVVVFPARILRINVAEPGGLVAAVTAADINARDRRDKRWQRWPLRQASPDQRGVLAAALASVRSEQQQAQQRLAQLEELIALIMTGVTAGTLTLAAAPGSSAPDSSDSDSLALPEGIS
ncbi:hypothetical protein [Cryobacterium sp. SO1]|uniref:hypothetical protein n=1 Tax=Cryobacterium sp. SO1 TaxID=1897061 RepID=UPI00210A2BDD|nr:hypothetical protein [Cryobacterium sp. SO1]